MKNAERHMRYIFSTMPKQICKALHYISKLNEQHTKYQNKYEKVYSQLTVSEEQKEKLANNWAKI